MEYAICKIIEHLNRLMPELSTIDEDYGQLESLNNEQENQYPLTFPAVLIASPDVQWSEVAQHNQKGLVTLTVRLILDCYDDTHAGAGGLAAAKERWELNRKLNLALQGYHPLDDGPLVRTSSHDFSVQYGLKVYETTYSMTLTDSVPERGTVSRPHIALHVAALKKI